jgi:RNA polymerase sigma-70 factor (ECF subfamily)
MKPGEAPTESSEPDARSTAESDSALVARIIAGDHAAFETVMRRYNRRLYRLARATLRDDAEAEDALQDAYLHAYRCLAQYRHESALATWLSRLVLNECFGRLRRTSRRQKVVPITSTINDSELNNVADQAEGPAATAVRSQMRALIQSKLDDLPVDFRLVFVLRCVEEMSVDDVAQYLQLPAATVRSRYFRARVQLRDALGREIETAERDLYEFGGARCDGIVATVMSRIDPKR